MIVDIDAKEDSNMDKKWPNDRRTSNARTLRKIIFNQQLFLHAPVPLMVNDTQLG